jgi:hypothetical protein
MRRWNGGIPSKCFFNAESVDDECRLDQFCYLDEFGVTPNPDGPAFSISGSHGREGFMVPTDCLIIGVCDGEDILLLRIRGERRGEVSLKIPCQLDMYADWSETREQEVYKLASSFSAFLKMLRDTSQYHE